MPVDYKHGKRSHVEHGAYDPERIRLCVQGLLLEEHGYQVSEGVLYFSASKERVRVVFDDALRAAALASAAGLRALASLKLAREIWHCTPCSGFTEASLIMTSSFKPPWAPAQNQMPPVSRLGRQITQAIGALSAVGARFALIGGLALASHKVIRATRDVDLLTEAEKADEIDAQLRKLGYRSLHRSADAANYVRGDERLDLLYANRPIARQLLAAARELTTGLGQLRVVSAEGLIGFKLQALANDPRRTQDMEDIRALLRANRAALDLEQVRGYFRLFERESLLDELLREIA